LLKNPECKKYIQYSKKFLGKSVFQGKRKVAQKSCMIKEIFNTVENFRANSVVSGQAQVAHKW